ncbi:aminoglycoside phosphotransferase family protein [Conexibacter sp. JD483]|uniref:aminoglycoside phosphotransferase family protein n=1 Tax=unclassified Conexibacter TaxID=2627773 RepID=UPI00271730FC|nr:MULTISPECIES: aminoglycoside phosphotransferase family protein [unclassified Conexibacter]MDO8184362.1 aminoglycoside phosphotransferase family protein [Conexibacter sp. CPCC 205706]MDO8197668.1 aminoglycoside phosphotransferase family protein [Conexibacter sp. CPCC 205762]MDR9368331.1 aminoglycoside phosphotransferase family protein [Conexibacter sp. JD483]
MEVAAQLAALRRRWAGYWPSADTSAIAADVDARLEAAVGAWDLAAPQPLPGGHVALVLVTGDGVLKLNPRGHADAAELAGEGAALAHWAPSGAVPRLLASRDDGFTLLLERLRPGTTLDAAGLSWDERLTATGALAARLHAAGAAPDACPHISGAYARGWREALARDPAALAELEALLAARDDDVLLHADLHGGNVLRAGDGWRAIDPHGVRGDRHADVWALIDPLAPPLPADPRDAAAQARAAIATYAAAARLAPERATAWARLRARAEALAIDADGDRADPHDRAWAQRLHRFADATS